MKRLTESELDFLKELSNIGVGHAATALSQLIGRQIQIKVPNINVVELSTVPELIGGRERVVSGIYLQVLGDARGAILLVFPDKNSKSFGNLLLKQEEGSLSEMGISTLKEIGNTLASVYLNILGKILNMTLIPSVPSLVHDMLGTVVDLVLVNLANVGDTAFVFETEFFNIEEDIKGHFLFLPEPDSVDIIMKALEKNR